MERKQEIIYCLCYFTIISRPTLFHFTHHLALFYITFLIKKIKRPVAKSPDGGGPFPGTNGTMGNPVLMIGEKIDQNSWFDRYTWVEFNAETDRARCFYHRLF